MESYGPGHKMNQASEAVLSQVYLILIPGEPTTHTSAVLCLVAYGHWFSTPVTMALIPGHTMSRAYQAPCPLLPSPLSFPASASGKTGPNPLLF